ncbi:MULTISPECIES: DUF6314 family protein [unclassified Yoonia]|uniref:DUF6314 family protein n=1 Tax=unclassified Yoonia TaxID=2629118 RepID=UPI002AFFCD65|nr:MULTISPECIES: DUF6314 family protein [unclassified Yoonia]
MLGRDDFAGRWQVVRRIDDRHGRMQGEFTGVAEMQPVGDAGLIYTESGQMRIGTAPVMQAVRRYLWDFGEGLVTVRFEDGRDFHTFVPAGQAAGTDHPCGADHYRVVYDFTRWPLWRATWDVTGPRKDYTSVTDYSRVVR